MISIRAFRNVLHFTELFAHVHPVCWPILWWRLNALLAWSKRRGGVDVFCSIIAGGFIALRPVGKAPDPGTFQPLPRTFRPLTDKSWGGDVRACLEPSILFREATGDVLRSFWRSRKGALPSPRDSS